MVNLIGSKVKIFWDDKDKVCWKIGTVTNITQQGITFQNDENKRIEWIPIHGIIRIEILKENKKDED